MNTVKVGLALALASTLVLGPLQAASNRQDGIISGSAAAEAKEPYSNYVVRARDVSTNGITNVTTLDANAEFALNGMIVGTYLVELVKGATPDGQGGKIICTAGPFTLEDVTSQVNDLMIERGANIRCNRPVAAWWLLGAAAAAGVTAGVVANGDDAPVVVTAAPVSGAQ
jgi:hypothetical protein